MKTVEFIVLLYRFCFLLGIGLFPSTCSNSKAIRQIIRLEENL